ncbi:MAG: hypothetical protein NTW79_03555 [Candidatus Berkelbacteria bacterium]|nr:hypothetical protein [Candidatus Berkelbacteria bacterium]
MPFSAELQIRMRKQIEADPTLLPGVVREAYAEVFGEENLDEKLTEMGIDLSRYGYRMIWEYVDKKPTGAIVAIPDYKERNDTDRIYFLVPRGMHDTLQHALDSKHMGKIPKKEIVTTMEGSIHISEAINRAKDHLRSTTGYLTPIIGKRATKKFLDEQYIALRALIEAKTSKTG